MIVGMITAPQPNSELPALPRTPDGWPPGRVVATTLTVVLVGLMFYLAVRFQVAIFAMVTAMMFQVALKPAFDWLRARGLRPVPSVLILFGGLVLLVAGVGALIAPILAEQLQGMVARVPEYYADLRTTLNASSVSVFSQIGSTMPGEWTALLSNGNLAGARPTSALDAVAPAAVVLSGIGTSIFLIVATFMITVHWTMDGDRMTGELLMRAPHDKRDGWRELIAKLEGKVGGYFRGQLILCGFIAVLSTTSYLVMGLPYALVLGLIAGIFEVLPMLGPVLGMLLPLLIALATRPDLAIWVVISAIVIQQIESNLLVPRVMDKSVGITPIVSILAITIFSLAFGLVGAMLAIPAAAILQILLGQLFINVSEEKEKRALEIAPNSPSRGYLSVVRLAARELAEDVRKPAIESTNHTNSAVEPAHELTDADGALQAIEDQLEAIARDLDQLLARDEVAQHADLAELPPPQSSTGALA